MPAADSGKCPTVVVWLKETSNRSWYTDANVKHPLDFKHKTFSQSVYSITYGPYYPILTYPSVHKDWPGNSDLQRMQVSSGPGLCQLRDWNPTAIHWSTVTATGFIYIYIYIYIYLSIHPSIYLSIYLYYICGNLSHHIISTIQSSTTHRFQVAFQNANINPGRPVQLAASNPSEKSLQRTRRYWRTWRLCLKISWRLFFYFP